jgi:hypothetical protein
LARIGHATVEFAQELQPYFAMEDRVGAMTLRKFVGIELLLKRAVVGGN